jgi:hypothetical protein
MYQTPLSSGSGGLQRILVPKKAVISFESPFFQGLTLQNISSSALFVKEKTIDIRTKNVTEESVLVGKKTVKIW